MWPQEQRRRTQNASTSSAPPAPFNLQGPEISHRQQRMKGKEYASTSHTQRYSLFVLTEGASGRNWYFHFAGQKTEASQSLLIFPKEMDGRAGVKTHGCNSKGHALPSCRLPGGIPDLGHMIMCGQGDSALSEKEEPATHLREATPGHPGRLVNFLGQM